MSSDSPPPRIDKGKARLTTAPPSTTDTDTLVDEHTPLLAASAPPYDPELVSPPRRPRWRPFFSVLLATLCATFLFALLLVLLAYTYAAEASHVSDDALLQRALVLSGPDAVDVLNISHPTQGDGDNNNTQPEIFLRFHARAALDASAVVDVSDTPDDSFFTSARKALGRWGVRRLDAVTVTLSPIDIYPADTPQHPSLTPLATIELAPFALPLVISAHAPPAPLTLIVRVRASTDAAAWLQFARASWATGAAHVRVSVPRASITGGTPGNRSWRRRLRVVRDDVEAEVRHKLPALPGFPAPGSGAPLPPLSSFVHLESYHISKSSDDDDAKLHIDANATLAAPLPQNMSVHVPALPFIVWIPLEEDNDKDGDDGKGEDGDSTPSPTLVPFARVTTLPTTLSSPPSKDAPNPTIAMTGTLLPLTPSTAPALGLLISHYLARQPSQIYITTPLLPPPPIVPPIPAQFPAPAHRPHVLRELALKDVRMRMRPDGSVLASGIVKARVVMPKAFDVPLEVGAVLPDVLVFDGPVPDPEPDTPAAHTARASSGLRGLEQTTLGETSFAADEPPVPPAPPLPDPLPLGAFAHIRPEEWLPATSKPEPDNGEDALRNTDQRSASRDATGEGDGEDGDGDGDGDGEEDGHATLVTARIADVALEVLPGREREFSAFVSRVVFGGGRGALAGVQGEAAVVVRLEGLIDGAAGGGMVVGGLPFTGSVRVGKRA